MNLKLIFKICPFKSRQSGWRDSWRSHVAWRMSQWTWRDSWGRRVTWWGCGDTSIWVTTILLSWLSHADCCYTTDRHVPSDIDRFTPCWVAWLTHQPPWRDSSIEYASPPFLFLRPLFLPSFLLTLRQLHWWFRVLPQNLRSWCEKSTPWVVILIVLCAYIIFTISFYCILKFSFRWTHVAEIGDEIYVFVISMYWLCCMNE
jgi:hypothetical protein